MTIAQKIKAKVEVNKPDESDEEVEKAPYVGNEKEKKKEKTSE